MCEEAKQEQAGQRHNLSFKKWLSEMCGTGAIYDPKTAKSPDFNWWGCPELYYKKRKKKNGS